MMMDGTTMRLLTALFYASITIVSLIMFLLMVIHGRIEPHSFIKHENYKNYPNEKEVYNFMNREKSFIKKVKSRVKRILRQIIPFFMEFKPRVTIVRTLKED